MMFNNDVSGAAALAIDESLILSLGVRNNLAESGVLGILQDVISAHLNAPADDGVTKCTRPLQYSSKVLSMAETQCVAYIIGKV
jgi:hypothetical protein